MISLQMPATLKGHTVSHRRLSWIIVIALLPAIGGCRSQSEIDEYQKLLRVSQGQNIDLKAQIDALNGRIVSLLNSPAIKVQDPATLAELEKLRGERQGMIDQLKSLEQRIRAAAKREFILPPDIDDALQKLAAQHADVMRYDAAAGMILMRSDLTFSSGSATVSARAQQSLAQLAAILSAVVKRGYEVRVVGHTDNQPIVRAKLQHPTNWHLSVHRAIAVMNVLEQAGVASTKLGVAGYGEYRPVAPNGEKGNRANRRVEIVIVAAAGKPSAPVEDAGPAEVVPGASPPAPQEETMK